MRTRRVLDREPLVRYACSERNEFVRRVPYDLGYGLTQPIALEEALKLREITYAHFEGIFSSEYKRGPLSALHDGYPVVFIAAPDDEMMINHVDEVVVRGGRSIAIAAEHPALARGRKSTIIEVERAARTAVLGSIQQNIAALCACQM